MAGRECISSIDNNIFNPYVSVGSVWKIICFSNDEENETPTGKT